MALAGSVGLSHNCQKENSFSSQWKGYDVFYSWTAPSFPFLFSSRSEVTSGCAVILSQTLTPPPGHAQSLGNLKRKLSGFCLGASSALGYSAVLLAEGSFFF